MTNLGRDLVLAEAGITVEVVLNLGVVSDTVHVLPHVTQLTWKRK